MDWGAPLCALQRLLHLLHLDCQMGFKVAAQCHAGVLGRLPAGENLVVTQQRPLVVGVQDFKCADLEKEREFVMWLLFGDLHLCQQGFGGQMSRGASVLPD